jgi:hypothetical protein
LGVGLSTHSSKLEVFKAANNTLSRANAAMGIGDFAFGAGLLMQQRLSSPYGFMVQATNSSADTFYPLLLNPSGGNVGIGTASPSSLLTVAGATDLAWSASTSKLQILRSGSQARINNYESGSGSSIAMAWDGGNVLIGTTTDSGYKLDVNGTGRFSGDLRTTGGNVGVYNSNVQVQFFDTANSNYQYSLQNYSGNFRLYNNTTSTTVLNFASTGAATFSSSVTAGGQLLVSYANPDVEGIKVNATTGTNASAMTFRNTSGNFFIGKDSSTGSRISSVAYSNAVWAENAYPLIFGVNNAQVLQIVSGGAATFSSSVTATSFFESSDSRLKTLIQDNYQTKGIASITPKLYTKNGKVELGYYAQDFVGILDSAVSKGSDDMLSLSYREVLVAKVYALEQEIKELKAKMN